MVPSFLVEHLELGTRRAHLRWLPRAARRLDAPSLADAGLVPIDSVAPSAPEKVSWLNIFYGIEWAVFAIVALFLWYRLARDAWEKEHEMMLLRRGGGR